MKNLLMLVLLGLLCVPAYANSPNDKDIEVKVYRKSSGKLKNKEADPGSHGKGGGKGKNK